MANHAVISVLILGFGSWGCTTEQTSTAKAGSEQQTAHLSVNSQSAPTTVNVMAALPAVSAEAALVSTSTSNPTASAQSGAAGKSENQVETSLANVLSSHVVSLVEELKKVLEKLEKGSAGPSPAPEDPWVVRILLIGMIVIAVVWFCIRIYEIRSSTKKSKAADIALVNLGVKDQLDKIAANPPALRKDYKGALEGLAKVVEAFKA